jgi:glycosyltransferase involved in cell wall biosynthesis
VKRSLYPYVKDKNKLHVIFNGIDTKKFKPLRKENIVICVGRIIPTKGQLHLLKAFSEMDTDWKLLMVGTCLEGKENMRYYKECLKYGRDNIEFTGEIWGDRLVDLYGKARIAVIPSICQEALPMVTLEAMASGCAIVATAMGGIPEMISDGRNGFLVPPMDPGMIQDRLGTLMGNERLLNDMAVKAMDDAVNIFDWEKIAGQYLDFYRSLS